MGVRSWLRGIVIPRAGGAVLPSRRERREAARRRHHETGAPAWTDDDRHLGPDGKRLVADVTPGTPGHPASVRTTRYD